jgi:hypothetical protein
MLFDDLNSKKRDYIFTKDRQSTYNVTLRGIHETIAVVEKRQVVYSLIVCM